MITKDLIGKKFSSAAENYEKYAFIQQEIGCALVDYLVSSGRDYRLIADIGTGTASVACLLSERYPKAKIFGLDIALGMLLKAKETFHSHLIQADAEYLPFCRKKFDLITSNLTYQWGSSLEKAFVEAGEALKSGGRFYFSVFGQETLSELKECLRKFRDKEDVLDIYPDSAKIYKLLLKAGFTDIEINSEKTKEFFPDFFALIQWLKLIGANQIGINFSGLSARGALEKMNQYYLENFPDRGGIAVSFNRIIVKAEKGYLMPHK